MLNTTERKKQYADELLAAAAVSVVASDVLPSAARAGIEFVNRVWGYLPGQRRDQELNQVLRAHALDWVRW